MIWFRKIPGDVTLTSYFCTIARYVFFNVLPLCYSH